jgi:glutathione S-transferase
MKVYGHPLSSCTRKVLATLAEKGIEAAFVKVDLFLGEHKAAAHMARQPFGVVPVLDDDGFVLYESRAILRYLEARFPEPALVPRAAREVARMDQWLSVDQSYVAPHTRALAIERIVKKREGLAADAPAERAAEGALGAALAVYDEALRGGPTYLVGETFTLADLSLAPYVASLSLVGAEHLLTGLPHLRSWWGRVRERPSWRAATSLPT